MIRIFREQGFESVHAQTGRMIENIIDAQRRNNLIVSSSETLSFLRKSVFQRTFDGGIGVRIWEIVEVATDNNRVRTLLNDRFGFIRFFRTSYISFVELPDK